MEIKLRLAHLYPRLMNIYGDRGNILCLERRFQQRGIGFEVVELELGDEMRAKEHDLIFIGGAQDREQRRVAEDLVMRKGQPLREAVEEGALPRADGGPRVVTVSVGCATAYPTWRSAPEDLQTAADNALYAAKAAGRNCARQAAVA